MNIKKISFVKVLILLAFLFLILTFDTYIGDEDRHAYYATTEQLGLNHKFTFDNPFYDEYQDHHFLPGDFITSEDNKMVSMFSPGSSIVRLPFFFILGRNGVYLTNILLGLILLYLTFIYTKHILGTKVAKITSILLLVNPLFYFMVDNLYSGLPATVFSLLAIYLLDKYIKSNKNSHLILSFILIAFSVSMRYVQGLFILPMMIYLLLNKKSVKDLIIGGFAFVVGAIPLMYYNYSIFGGIFKHGYSKLATVGFHTVPSLEIMYQYYIGTLFAIPATFLILLGALLYYKKDKKRTIFYSLIILSFVGFWISYPRFYPSLWFTNLRWFLPLLPFFMIFLGYLITQLSKKFDKKSVGIFLSIFILINISVGMGTTYQVDKTYERNTNYALFVKNITEENAVIILKHWDKVIYPIAKRNVYVCQFDDANLTTINTLIDNNIPLYYMMHVDEKETDSCHGTIFNNYKLTLMEDYSETFELYMIKKLS